MNRPLSALAIVSRIVMLLSLAIAVSEAAADDRAAVTTYRHAGWHVAETTNFRLYHALPEQRACDLVERCETMRTQLRKAWLMSDDTTSWTPKCDVFLYASPSHFQRGTGNPPDRMGYASLNVGKGRVSMRRLHMRADEESILERVLPHELTHVVLADRFSYHRIPRWADEGVAVTSEPAAQRNELRVEARTALQRGRLFSIRQLVQLRDYPRDPASADLFYAQSAAVIEYLQQQTSPADTIRFVELCTRSGLDGASRDVLKRSAAEFEADWRRWLASAPLVDSATIDGARVKKLNYSYPRGE